MLNKCANPGCVQAFRKLEDGKLFLLEMEAPAGARLAGEGRGFPPPEQYYWLCDGCAAVMTLSFEPDHGVVAVPLARPVGKRPAASVRLGTGAGASSGNSRTMQAALGGSNEA